MNIIVLNSKSKNETSQYKGNNIVHVRMSNFIGGGNPKQREQKERRHGGNRHWYGLSNPPWKHPRKNPQHVPTARRSIEFCRNTDNRTEQRSQQNEKVFQSENGSDAWVKAVWPVNWFINGKQRSLMVLFGRPRRLVITSHVFCRKQQLGTGQGKERHKSNLFVIVLLIAEEYS